MSEDTKRLVDLELRYMKLERLVEELSAVVAEQQKLVDALVTHSKRVRDRLRDLGEETGGDEKPPHY